MERAYRFMTGAKEEKQGGRTIFSGGDDPSKMSDADLFNAVREHSRGPDATKTGEQAKPDTPEEAAARDEAVQRRADDADLKAAFPWMTDAHIQKMTPDMRQVWINRARGPKPGEKPAGERPAEDTTEQPGTATTSSPDKVVSEAGDGSGAEKKVGDQIRVRIRNADTGATSDEHSTWTVKSVRPDGTYVIESPVHGTMTGSKDVITKAAYAEAEAKATGTREAPIAAKTADDVRAAQPVEPKSAAQAEAENYKHAHMELEHLGLKGQNSISIETGVGQTRKGPPGPDGKPAWEVKMEQGAYGRIKGTKGADGQPLDIMVGPHPASPHVFIINQHDPATGKFDELKIQAGYRTPLDAMHAYAVSFDDHAHGRVGGMVAMTPEQFQTWLKTGDHTAPVQHASNPASVLARAFPDAGQQAKAGESGSSVGVKRVASSPGLHNAGEEAHRPLTEAPAEGTLTGVPKGSQARDANEANARPTDTINPNAVRSKAETRNLSGYPNGASLSLLEFLADRGGIAPHPELEVLGLGPSHRVQIPGRKGFFGLVKEGGWDTDTAREAAEEEGYLQGENGNVTSTPKQFLDAVDAELRGTKLYPYQSEGQRTKTEDRLAAEREEYERSRAQEIEDELDEAGYGEVAGELRQRALRHMAIGTDPETAIQTAMAEMDAEYVLETPADFDAIYGDGAYGEILAGIPYEGGPISSGQSSEDHWSYEDALDRVGARAPDRGAEARSEEAADAEAAGRDESPAEGGPVRESAVAADDTAGRSEAAGDETRDTARHELAAEDADDAGAVAPRYDYDGATGEMQAGDSDETVTVTLSRKGPWDFSETFPAPLPEQLKGLEANGRWPFSDMPADIGEIANATDAGVYDMMGEIGAMRAADLQIEGLRTGKIKLKGKKKPADEIEALKKERAKAADDLRQLQGVYEDIFGRDASNAMVKEARRRLVDEDRLAGKAKADEPRKVAEFIKHIEAEIGAGRMDAGISPTRDLDAFRKAAEARGWTYGAYGKGKALWSPDRKHTILASVSVEGNHVTAQWGTPLEGITPPGGTESAKDDARGQPIVETGAVFKTASGRHTAPAPKIDATTDRRTKKAIFNLNSWLLDEARKEVAGSDYQTTLLKGIDPKNMSQSDQDTVNSLLFGDPDGPRPSDLVSVEGKTQPKKAKSVDDLTAAEKKAHRDAPTWAQVLAELPMHKDGRTREFEIAFDIIKEITGKKKAPKFDDLTPEQKGELYERVKALKPVLDTAEAHRRRKATGREDTIKEALRVKKALEIADEIEAIGNMPGFVTGIREFIADGHLTADDDLVQFRDRLRQAQEKAGLPTTETGADNKQQTVIPGAEKASDKTMAQRGADAGLKPKVAQKSADVGLFGDERNQTDMFSTPAKKPAPAPKDEFDDIFEQKISEQFAKPVSLDQATEGLKAIFAKKPGDKLSDQTESLEGFSEDTYAQALPFLKAGLSHFSGAGDLPSMVGALVSHLANAGMDADAIRAMKPYIRRIIEDVRSGKETINAPSRREVLERDRANADAQDRVGAADVPAAAERAGPGAGARGG